MQQQILRLKKQKLNVEKALNELEKNMKGLTCTELNSMKKIKETCLEGDSWACLMMDQLKNDMRKSSKGYRWSQEVIRHCIILHARSPGAYIYLRKSDMIKMSSPKTLRSYVGSSTLDVGFTDMVKETLRAKIEELGDGLGKHVNLALDEVAIKTGESYMKNVDKVLGDVDMGGIVTPKDNEKLANKLLTFAINGLADSFCIIEGYFLVNKLTAGFTVVGTVADNASTNTKMFRLINPEGILTHEIPHPNDAKRKLFLSFDSSHIIKNLRNQLINRTLQRKGKPIMFAFIKRLYEMQKNLTLKLVKKTN